MAHAYNAHQNAEVVAQAVRDPTKEERQHFRCWYCREIPVEFVSGSTDKNGTLVRAHFRRSRSHAQHHKTCGFDFDAHLSSWKGRAVEVITQSKKKFILSLNHLISDYTRKIPAVDLAQSTEGFPSGNFERGASAQGSDPEGKSHAQRLLRMTCHAAQELWHLARIADDDASIQDRVILKLQSRTIAWSEFFFRHDIDGELARLWAIIHQHGEMPVCILGKVHVVQTNVIPQKENARPYDRMELKWDLVPAGGHFAVRIGTRIPGIISRFAPGEEIIACGNLRLQEKTEQASRGKKVHAWLWLQVADQLAKRDDGGAATPGLSSPVPGCQS